MKITDYDSPDIIILGIAPHEILCSSKDPDFGGNEGIGYEEWDV